MKPDRLKTLGLSLMLAGGVSVAQATTLPNNDLFLNAYDTYQSTSYNIDLGVSLATFISEDSNSLVLPTSDSGFFSWVNNTLANGGSIIYNIAAANLITPKGTTLDGLLVSEEPGNKALDAAQNLFQMGGLQTTILNRIANINGVGGVGLVPSDTFSQGLAGFYSTGGTWGEGQGSPSVNDSTTLGGTGLNTLELLFEHTTGISTGLKNSTVMTLEKLPGTFSIDAANSHVVWNVASVPVPGAVWLFSGGLIAMLKLQKRKSNI
ncbi:hypothetical protein KEF85_10105 [Methylomonas paludis]|uniref:Secreted protein n=1 Tax=Methylomonas paludis TaxID=1173101 RepID=A0A975MKZ4_9GAMM|nr:hypothetical protein [Methylomonas paludis]QWF69727.1 hypothetical protein KEF85_10105 [Methylomonas paludis]